MSAPATAQASEQMVMVMDRIGHSIFQQSQPRPRSIRLLLHPATSTADYISDAACRGE